MRGPRFTIREYADGWHVFDEAYQLPRTKAYKTARKAQAAATNMNNHAKGGK